MRSSLFLIALAAAAPAAAQTAPPPRALPELPPELTDPATADRLADVMQALGQAFLALPVGPIEAAVEGRAATPADQRRTIRDLARRDDPNFDRKIAERMAQTRPMVQQSIKAIQQALPAVMQSFKQAGEAIERAAANMPDPTYPKR